MSISEIERIKVKLNKLRDLDKEYKIHGADKHKYILSKVLSNEEIKAFESEYNIILPEEYKLFLTEIGGSGAGPYYGLYPLLDSTYFFPHEEKLDEYKNRFDIDFPHNEAWLMENFEPLPEWDDETEAAKRDEYLDKLYDTKNSASMLMLSHFGCGALSD